MSLGILSSGLDTSFSLNKFSAPKLITADELAKNIIFFILFSKPGAYPSLPMIGMNIQQYLYNFYDEIDVDLIKNKLVEQCSFLEEYFSANNITITKSIKDNKPSLDIQINYSPMKDDTKLKNYHIGITYDELNQMIYTLEDEE